MQISISIAGLSTTWWVKIVAINYICVFLQRKEFLSFILFTTNHKIKEAIWKTASYNDDYGEKKKLLKNNTNKTTKVNLCEFSFPAIFGYLKSSIGYFLYKILNFQSLTNFMHIKTMILISLTNIFRITFNWNWKTLLVIRKQIRWRLHFIFNYVNELVP